MKPRWRILLVVTRTPARERQLASSEDHGLPPRQVVGLAARLFRLGAEVRVIDQDGEHLGDRVVRREARLWRADLALFHAGGSPLADNPVPDPRPLASLVDGWWASVPVLVCGPLASRYGPELVQTVPGLAGALTGDVTAALIGGLNPAEVPGLCHLSDGEVVTTPLDSEPVADVMPAWHLLHLSSYDGLPGTGPAVRKVGVLLGNGTVERCLREVRHATARAGATWISFRDRDLGADPERLDLLARGIIGAGPATPWSCRIRADRLNPMLAVTLANGGCKEVVVTYPGGPDAPGASPMDDPGRSRIEGAVEAVRVTGLTARVEHTIGRTGHTAALLAAWQRWFADRRILVAAQVKVLHAGDRGPGRPTLSEALAQAGCWDNELTPRDVETAVRMLSPRALAAASR